MWARRAHPHLVTVSSCAACLPLRTRVVWSTCVMHSGAFSARPFNCAPANVVVQMADATVRDVKDAAMATVGAVGVTVTVVGVTVPVVTVPVVTVIVAGAMPVGVTLADATVADVNVADVLPHPSSRTQDLGPKLSQEEE